MTQLGINGFGRIGRLIFRANMLSQNPLPITSINNPGLSTEHLLYLLKYDSAHGRLRGHNIEQLSENEI